MRCQRRQIYSLLGLPNPSLSEKGARRIPNATTCRNGSIWTPRCSLPDILYRLMPRTPISEPPCTVVFLRAGISRINVVGYSPLSSAATAGPIRAHHRTRPLPDRKGTRITRRDGGIWWTLPATIRPPPTCRAGALPNELKAQSTQHV